MHNNPQHQETNIPTETTKEKKTMTNQIENQAAENLAAPTRNVDEPKNGKVAAATPELEQPSIRPVPNRPEPLDEAEEDPITIEAKPLSGRIQRVIVKRGGEIKLIDEVALTVQRVRDELALTISALTGIPANKAREWLLQLASELDDGPVPATTSPPRADDFGGLDEDAARALEETPEDVLKDARETLRSPELMQQIVKDVQKTGVAGEDELIAALYLVAVSRMLPKPLSAIIQGSSSSGKSFVLDKVGKLMPDEAVVRAVDMTANSLYYMPQGSLVHRLVLGGERSRGKAHEKGDATRALREMITTGELSKAVPVKMEGELVTYTIRQRGPIAFVETTTIDEIFEEDANRCVLLSSDESSAQTRRVIAVQAKQAGAETDQGDPIIARHHAMQRMLKRVHVTVPFAEALIENFPVNISRARRAFEQLLALIQASALLHQTQRSENELAHGDTIHATQEDYATARRLLSGPLARSLQGGMAEALKRFAAWLASTFPEEPFTCREIRRHAQAPLTSKDKINTYARELVDLGLLQVVQQARGAIPTKWRIDGDIQDADAAWLPEPHALPVNSEPQE